MWGGQFWLPPPFMAALVVKEACQRQAAAKIGRPTQASDKLPRACWQVAVMVRLGFVSYFFYAGAAVGWAVTF
jgi:hypothetical protein